MLVGKAHGSLFPGISVVREADDMRTYARFTTRAR